MIHADDIGTAYIDPDKYADNLSIVAFWPSCWIVLLSGHGLSYLDNYMQVEMIHT